MTFDPMLLEANVSHQSFASLHAPITSVVDDCSFVEVVRSHAASKLHSLTLPNHPGSFAFERGFIPHFSFIFKTLNFLGENGHRWNCSLLGHMAKKCKNVCVCYKFYFYGHSAFSCPKQKSLLLKRPDPAPPVPNATHFYSLRNIYEQKILFIISSGLHPSSNKSISTSSTSFSLINYTHKLSFTKMSSCNNSNLMAIFTAVIEFWTINSVKQCLLIAFHYGN